MELTKQDSLGFTLLQSQITGRCYVPRYYDPELERDIEQVRRTSGTVSFGDLIKSGFVSVSSGHEVGKMAYGTGSIPFVRTSDIANWEIKTDPKHGVNRSTYAQYSSKQDLRAGDLLFVRDGTYLIGMVAPVMDDDLPMLFQSHLLRFRVAEASGISPWLLLAALSAPIVRRQVKAKQFTADIIDTIGDRYTELELPIPNDEKERASITERAQKIVETRIHKRRLIGRLPQFAQGMTNSLDEQIPSEIEAEVVEPGTELGFLRQYSQVTGACFIPRYYEPRTQQLLEGLSTTHDLTSVDDLVASGVLSLATGVEPGKMAYGTGDIPFVRTSDFANWELKTDSKHSVSEPIFRQMISKADVQPEDILLVRDGTYLVGSSCVVTHHDVPMLFAGGLYRLRVTDPKAMDPFLLFVLLNCPVVRRQMKDKQFTRDIIDTIGHRILEVVLPIPRDEATRLHIAAAARDAVVGRTDLREAARELIAALGS